ncbi:TPM domain-containing protein [Hymenobacter sp. IS2118]|uniref:TPM domain-containing protein n=1 Tax=Hymenobacter sp. IS2118 TaxID=1505605 RepID=UPI0009DDC1D2|nr:TPM domain-containing protein [Hymenobacter sp. IS2118]
MPITRPVRFLWLLALALLVGCEPEQPAARITAANYLTAIPDPKTLGERYVSDPDALLQPGTADDLNARLDSLDHSGRAHIDVVLVTSIGGEVPKTAATALFNQWKIGDKTKSNGLLMLLVMDQRRIEFETGYGLEADLPDIICYRIQQEYMVPEMRAGRLDAAVLAGVAALIRKLGGTAPLTLDQRIDSLNNSADARLLERVSRPDEEPGSPPSQGYDAETNRATYAAGEAEAARQTDASGSRWGWPLGLAAGLSLVAGLVLATSKGEKRSLRLGKIVVAGVVFGLLALSFQSWLVLLYLVPLLLAHGYFLWRYARTRQPEWQARSRHEQYQTLAKIHHNLGFTAWLFPLGLSWYWPWHRRRLALLRDAAYTCPTCGQPMRRLDPTAEIPHLKAGQQAEEKVESVDYDVWQCRASHLLELAYPNLRTSMQECPACHYQTLETTHRHTAKAATTSSAGWGWETFRCQACKHEIKEKYTIPRIATSSDSSSGGSSSLSSSSSSSSGGSSGGGGAGSSW